MPRAWFLCSLTASALSSAQSIELAPTQFKIERFTERGSSEYPFWLNRRDCLEDARYGDNIVTADNPEGTDKTRIVINPRVTPVGSRYSLQAWVGNGVDCTANDERRPNGNCWNVMNEIARVSGTDYYIYPRDILARGSEDRTEAVCNSQVEWASTFFFLLFNGDQLLASTKWDQTQVDTRAPAPPDGVTASGGDERLFLEWDVPIDQVDVDAEGYQFFCGPGSEVDGGAQGALGGSGGEAPTCTSDDLTPGEFPQGDDAFCGESTGLASLTGRTTRLTNGVTYGVAVASTDRVGNIGKLSAVACGTPEPVIGFFERYKQSGGKGGGGFCGISPASRDTAPWLLALVSLSALLFVQRKRRRLG